MTEKKNRVVKARWAGEKAITAWGGLALAERLAHRTRLWGDGRRLLPARTGAAPPMPRCSSPPALVKDQGNGGSANVGLDYSDRSP